MPHRPLSAAARLPRSVRVLLAVVALGTLLRVALLAFVFSPHGAASVARAVALGASLDALVACALLAPLFALFALRRQAVRARTSAALWFAALWALAFLTVVEFFFFEEFQARFNHLAIDYVLFPGEVAGNVWESYPVPTVLAATALVAALATWWVTRAAVGDGRRPRAALGWVGAALVAWLALAAWPEGHGGDRRMDELASNDLVTLERAVRTATLDYASFYRTVSPERLDQTAQNSLGWPDAARPGQRFVAHERRDEPLDVVVVLGESFGSEFVGRLGGTSPCAPGLERWAREGLLLTNLVATGNRTVRGLEGVLCSFPPLPGDSIWKRDRSEGLATLASVLRDQGYHTEFLYGGDGRFDRMRDFALANGWEEFRDDSLLGGSSFPDDAYRTIWGVADEHLFDALLERQREARDAGRRLFATALTVSNHKPFLTPDTLEYRVRTEKLAGLAPSIGLLLVLTGGWVWRTRRRRGALRGALSGLVGLGLTGLFVWNEVHPKGTRVEAVSYADRALADYLDRARDEGLLEHTVVLFVGDHGARVYGSERIPAASYRVPALFLAPEARYHGRTFDGLCSQVDLAPTLLSLAGVDYEAPFFGRDLLAEPEGGPGRAWLLHNRDIGLLTDSDLVVLGLEGSLTCYGRSGRDSDVFESIDCDGRTKAEAEEGAALMQLASTTYDDGRYRLGDAP